MKAYWKKYQLKFKRPSGTSRGIIQTKDSWFIFLEKNEVLAIGECGLLKGLSIDDVPNYETKLHEICQQLSQVKHFDLDELMDFPSIRFGLEMALLDLKNSGGKIFFPSAFTESKAPIKINGLIWMGEHQFMKEQIQEKIEAGYSCIKLKIGAINFEEELNLLSNIRKEFSPKEIELRVDANGAFKSHEAEEKLKRLSEFQLHSIEQPIKQNQYELMRKLCEHTPLPIALDEELIGVNEYHKKEDLLDKINPQYIILKPSLVGGFQSCNEWIELAEAKNIGWWITSALESNIGLNAIAQYTFTKENLMPQGLGTGQLYTNNFESPLFITDGKLNYNKALNWNISNLIS